LFIRILGVSVESVKEGEGQQAAGRLQIAYWRLEIEEGIEHGAGGTRHQKKGVRIQNSGFSFIVFLP
jgi:hypothetical protein